LPANAPGGICPVRTNVLVVPAATVLLVHVTVPPEPTGGLLHDQVGPEVWFRETNVMSAGRVSVSCALDAASGPRFVTSIVKVASEFTSVWSESTVLVTSRSALGVGVNVVAVDSLFSSFGSLGSLTLAIFVMAVPGGVEEGICTTNEKTLSLPGLNAAFVQVTVPPPPAEGTEQLHVGPEVWVKETRVVPVGTASVSVALLAWSGPKLPTSIV
jgi:hypothetical protein